MTVRILIGDCRQRLAELPAESVQCCVTSPPYFGLRDYGVDGQIGLEATPDAFVAEMVAVFRAVRRVLRADGTLWLNLGDSYAGSWGNYGGQNRGNGTQRPITAGSSAMSGAYEGKEAWRPATSNKLPGLKPKDLIGIPWRVVFALQADGWWLRQDIIWAKPNPMPESVTDRCTKAHEYLFLLTKSERYWFDAAAIAEASIDPESHRGRSPRGDDKFASHDPDGFARTRAGFSKLTGRVYETRNRRSVWTVATQPYADAHFATFPPALIEPCILAGCPAGGTVLDPFFGAGTTGLVADRLGRDCIGIELNPAYAEMARRRISDEAPMFSTVTTEAAA